MSITVILEKLRAALEAVNIPYFVTGSLASSAHGVPRATNNLDIVIAPSRQQFEQLLGYVPAKEFGTDKDDALDALVRKSLFNVVHYESSWKPARLNCFAVAADADRLMCATPLA